MRQENFGNWLTDKLFPKREKKSDLDDLKEKLGDGIAFFIIGLVHFALSIWMFIRTRSLMGAMVCGVSFSIAWGVIIYGIYQLLRGWYLVETLEDKVKENKQ